MLALNLQRKQSRQVSERLRNRISNRLLEATRLESFDLPDLPQP